jgi:AraC-like DNA-binding protein
MPVCDGIELCKRIRSNPDTDNLPIIILTSESSDKTMIYSLNLDVDHFINKPFNPLMLQGAVAHSMRVRERMMSRLRRTEVGFDYNETTIDSPDDKLFGKVIQAIKAHIDDSTFGVNELASEVGVSRVHLNRKMKERYGMSPVNFIRSYRLKQSAYLLVNNKVSISDVAYRMGFSSHPYFSNVFRAYFGMSPKEFVAYYADNGNDEVLQKMLE